MSYRPAATTPVYTYTHAPANGVVKKKPEYSGNILQEIFLRRWRVQMTQLKNTIVRRGGETAKNWYETIDYVSLKTAERVRITFSMSSKGGGRTDVQVEIPSADFRQILEAMCTVDQQTALEAMSEVMRDVNPQAASKAMSKAFERKGEQRIHDAAREKYFAKPRGQRDEKDLMIYQAICDLMYPVNVD